MVMDDRIFELIQPMDDVGMTVTFLNHHLLGKSYKRVAQTTVTCNYCGSKRLATDIKCKGCGAELPERNPYA